MRRRPPEWLASAAFYQIYPASFLDTNGDGIGDLEGIIRSLDYIRDLGCNALWLNPCYESPFGDGGYDISDHTRVAPRYGTNAELERLFLEAHEREMRVVLDLVPGHTSVEHPWFKASAARGTSDYDGYYIWTDDALVDAPPPWKSVGGFAERDGCYVTNFFWFQPALNYGFASPDSACPWQKPVDHPDCKSVKQQMIDVMQYWLERGADGFRVDMAFSLVKGSGDIGYRATQEFWHDIRQWLDQDFPDAVLISEWSNPPKAIGAGFDLDFMIQFGHPAFTSLFFSDDDEHFAFFPRTPAYFKDHGEGTVHTWLERFEQCRHELDHRGWIAIPSGNHDIPPRIADHRSHDCLLVTWTFLLTLPTVPFIYYGDEVGMRYVPGLPSKEGGYKRTGSRTPMQWDSSAANAGFSSADPSQLYLPIDPRTPIPAVRDAEGNPSPVREHIKFLLRLRKEFAAFLPQSDWQVLGYGDRGYPFLYSRSDGKSSTIWILLNPGSAPTKWSYDSKTPAIELKTLRSQNLTVETVGQNIFFSTDGPAFGIFEAFENA